MCWFSSYFACHVSHPRTRMPTLFAIRFLRLLPPLDAVAVAVAIDVYCSVCNIGAWSIMLAFAGACRRCLVGMFAVLVLGATNVSATHTHTRTHTAQWNHSNVFIPVFWAKHICVFLPSPLIRLIRRENSIFFRYVRLVSSYNDLAPEWLHCICLNLYYKLVECAQATQDAV